MGFRNEVLRTPAQIQGTEEIRSIFIPSNLNRSELKVSSPHIRESGLTERIREISRLLFAEGQKGKEAEKQPEKLEGKGNHRNNDFEPFVNPEPTNNQKLFVNAYAGNFAQQMSLNRKAVERVLEIAHLDGQVFLTSFSPFRSRAIGEDDKRENPLSRIVSIPQGWKIEINDTRIRQELESKEKLTGKELQTAFIKKFNGLIIKGLLECISGEKLSSKKDRYFRIKFLQSAIIPVIPFALTVSLWNFLPRPLSLAGLDMWAIDVINYAGIFCFYGLFNLLDHQINKGNKRTRDRLVKMNNLGLESTAPYRKIDHIWEYFMPMVEIDKTIRSLAFLSMKGRRLVKENK